VPLSRISMVPFRFSPGNQRLISAAPPGPSGPTAGRVRICIRFPAAPPGPGPAFFPFRLFPFSPFRTSASCGMIMLRVTTGSDESSQVTQKTCPRQPSQCGFCGYVALVGGFGFTLQRTRGSHHIFVHPDIPELINLQEVGGEAKPYQIRQFLRLVEKYNISLGDSE